jgi:signal transduction histidine kinase
MLQNKSDARFFAFISVQPCFEPCHEKTIIVFLIYDREKQQVPKRGFREDHYEDLVRIANGIAHELRNPLVGIGGFVSRLYKSCRLTPDHDTYYTYIVSNLKKIEALVKKVELFASLPKPSFTESPIDEVAKKALEPFLSKIEQRKIHLSVSLDKVALFLDEGLVVKALAILIDNAIDALPDGGSILITNEIKDNHCTVTVADTGSGISPDDLPFIFNPFFSTKPEGVGIDLALVKRIMESHGGHVEVFSKQNEGTSFLLMFPLERRRFLRICSLKD